MIYRRTRFHMRSSGGSLGITTVES